MNKSEIVEFFAEEFPHYDKISIDEVGEGSATMRHRISSQELRPGGTVVAGPISMLLADVVIYVAILGQPGRIPLTVTTSLNINFCENLQHTMI